MEPIDQYRLETVEAYRAQASSNWQQQLADSIYMRLLISCRKKEMEER
ncbi:hypothetical protein [Schleiferilactobacillus harbinensis]|nr:hypothetical protein [Schleiferilactobacillus harbinensis]